MRTGIVFLFLSLLGSSAFAGYCFTITPKSKLDDVNCSPAPVHIDILDCSDKAKILDKQDVVARFECRTRPRRLKYWYKDAMLVAEVEPSKKQPSGYAVGTIYSMGGGAKASAEAKPAETKPKEESKVAAAVAVAETQAPKHEGPVVSPHLGTPAAGSNGELEKLTSEKPGWQNKPAEEKVAPAQQPVAASAASPTLIHPSRFKFSGMIDTYYAYNFLKPHSLNTYSYGTTATPTAAQPGNQNLYRFYDGRHDEITLALAKLSVSQDAEPVGFKLDLGFGPAADKAAGPGADESLRNLLQAYFTYKTDFGLKVEAGKMYSHVGYETFEAANNANYSHSLAYAYIQPVWHNGMCVSYGWQDMVTVKGIVSNGWNNAYETNRNKTFGGQIEVKPVPDVGVIGNIISGQETSTAASASGAPVGTQGDRTIMDLVVWAKPLEALKLAANYDTGSETLLDQKRTITSTVFYATYDLLEALSLSARYEMFNDSDGVTFGSSAAVGQKINSTTGTVEYRVNSNLKLRAEYRSDVSDKTNFVDYTSDPAVATSTQSTALVSGLLTF